jgi:hypothetical protein
VRGNHTTEEGAESVPLVVVAVPVAMVVVAVLVVVVAVRSLV